MITKWLKDRTPEEREKHLQELIAMPLKKLQHFQDVNSASKRKAFELYEADKNSQWIQVRNLADAKFDPIFENIDIQGWDYLDAIDRKCFPEVKV
jgi:hypothetical protein